jgi:malate synthase
VLKGSTPAGAEIVGAAVAGTDAVLTPDALAFLAALHRRFEPTRL